MLRPVIMAVTAVVGISGVGIPAAVAQSLVPCAPEHGFCRVPYPTRVFYGVPGRHAVLEVGGPGIPCSNAVFGDPAPGFPKRCAFVARTFGGGYRRDERRAFWGMGENDGAAAWRTCADENGFCGFRGTRRVRYGARGRFAEGIYRGGVGCNNGTFGDPVPGVPKVCQILD